MNGDAFSPYLLTGEQLVWWDQPKQGIMLTPRDALMIPFSLLWGGFAVFWEASVISTHAPFFFALWGIPFVLAGFFIAVGRFFADGWLRRRTMYALTNRRVLIVRSAPFARFIALDLEQLPAVSLLDSHNGRGTIRFGTGPQSPAATFGNRGNFGAWMPAMDPTPQFLAIADAQRVFNEIQKRQPRIPVTA